MRKIENLTRLLISKFDFAGCLHLFSLFDIKIFGARLLLRNQEKTPGRSRDGSVIPKFGKKVGNGNGNSNYRNAVEPKKKSVKSQ